MAQLNGFAYDDTTGRVTLYFDSPVNSINTAEVYALYSATANTGSNLNNQLYGAVLGEGTSTLTIDLTPNSQAYLRSLVIPGVGPYLWNQQQYTWIYIPYAYTTDPILSTLNPIQIAAGNLTINTNRPTILSVDYQEANTQVSYEQLPWNLRINFDQPILLPTINDLYLLNSGVTTATANVKITDGNESVWDSGTYVYFKFSNAVWNTVRTTSGLAANIDTTFLYDTGAFQTRNNLSTLPTIPQAATYAGNVAPPGYIFASEQDLVIADVINKRYISSENNGNLATYIPTVAAPTWSSPNLIANTSFFMARSSQTVAPGTSVTLSNTFGSWQLGSLATTGFYTSAAFEPSSRTIAAINFDWTIQPNLQISSDGGYNWANWSMPPNVYSTKGVELIFKSVVPDQAGGIYITNSGGNTIMRYTPSANYVYGVAGLPSLFSAASGIAMRDATSLAGGMRATTILISTISNTSANCYYTTNGFGTTPLQFNSMTLLDTDTLAQTNTVYWSAAAVGDGFSVLISNAAFGNMTSNIVSIANNFSVQDATSTGSSITIQNRLPVSADWTQIAFGNKTFVAVARNGNTTVAVTSSAIKNYGSQAQWQQGGAGLPANVSVSSLVFGGGYFYLSFYQTSAIYQSSDGLTWTTTTSVPFSPNTITSMTYNSTDNQLVVFGGNIDLPAVVQNNDLSSVIWDGSQWVVVGSNGTIALGTANAIQWSNIGASNINTTRNLHKVYYSPTGRYVAVGGMGTILTTTNANSWANVSPGTTRNNILNQIAYGNSRDLSIAVGANLTIQSSNIFLRLGSNFSGLVANTVTYSSRTNLYYAAGGLGGTVTTIPGGSAGSPTIPVNTTAGLQVNSIITFTGTFSGLTAYVNYYITSIDTVNNTITLSLTQGGSAVNLTSAIAGNNTLHGAVLWSSPDGATWTQLSTSGINSDISEISYTASQDIFLASANYYDNSALNPYIFYSQDALNWTRSNVGPTITTDRFAFAGGNGQQFLTSLKDSTTWYNFNSANANNYLATIGNVYPSATVGYSSTLGNILYGPFSSAQVVPINATTGSNANFTILSTSTGYSIASIQSQGNGYAAGNTISIGGNLLSGTVPTNNATITITSVTGPNVFSNVYANTGTYNANANAAGNIATFNITAQQGSYAVTSNRAGINYGVGNTITIWGNALGGFTGTNNNNVVITITSVYGNSRNAAVNTTRITGAGTGFIANISANSNGYIAGTVIAGGSGYSVSDTVSANGNSWTGGATPYNNTVITITSIGGGGTVTGFTVTGLSPANGIATFTSVGNSVSGQITAATVAGTTIDATNVVVLSSRASTAGIYPGAPITFNANISNITTQQQYYISNVYLAANGTVDMIKVCSNLFLQDTIPLSAANISNSTITAQPFVSTWGANTTANLKIHQVVQIGSTTLGGATGYTANSSYYVYNINSSNTYQLGSVLYGASFATPTYTPNSNTTVVVGWYGSPLPIAGVTFAGIAPASGGNSYLLGGYSNVNWTTSANTYPATPLAYSGAGGVWKSPTGGIQIKVLDARANVLRLTSTQGLSVNQRVMFAGTSAVGAALANIYYISSITGSNISLSASLLGPNISFANAVFTNSYLTDWAPVPTDGRNYYVRGLAYGTPATGRFAGGVWVAVGDGGQIMFSPDGGGRQFPAIQVAPNNNNAARFANIILQGSNTSGVFPGQAVWFYSNTGVRTAGGPILGTSPYYINRVSSDVVIPVSGANVLVLRTTTTGLSSQSTMRLTTTLGVSAFVPGQTFTISGYANADFGDNGTYTVISSNASAIVANILYNVTPPANTANVGTLSSSNANIFFATIGNTFNQTPDFTLGFAAANANLAANNTQMITGWGQAQRGDVYSSGVYGSDTNWAAAGFNSVIWDGTRFKAAGVAGNVLISTDGVNWTQESVGTTQNINSVTYVANLNMYLAAADRGTILISPTATDWWTTQTTTVVTNTNLNQIAWNNNKSTLLAVGDSPTGTYNYPITFLSSDGVNWTLRPVPMYNSYDLRDALSTSFGNGNYVVVGTGNGINTSGSTTGIWTSIQGGNIGFTYNTPFANRPYLYALGLSTATPGTVYMSNTANLVSNQAIQFNSTTVGNGLSQGNLVTGQQYYVSYFANGAPVNGPANISLSVPGYSSNIAFSANYSPANGTPFTNFLTVTDWQANLNAIPANTISPPMFSIANVNSVLYAVGGGLTVQRSGDNGSTWQNKNQGYWTAANNYAPNLNGIAFNNANIMAVGNRATVLMSPLNGNSWSVPQSLVAVANCPNLIYGFYTVGNTSPQVLSNGTYLNYASTPTVPYIDTKGFTTPLNTNDSLWIRTE